MMRKFSEILENYLTARREHRMLLDQRPQNRELIIDSEGTLQRRRDDIDGFFQDGVQAVDMPRMQIVGDEQPLVHDHGVGGPEMVQRLPDGAGAPKASSYVDELIAESLRQFMATAGMDAAQVADKTGLSQRTIERVLDTADGMTITMDTARRLMPAINRCACCGTVISKPVEPHR